MHLIQAFLNQATTQGSRSTVLRPLGWLIAICASAALAAVEFHDPAWLLVLFAVSTGLGIVLYLGSYVYCLATKREDLLRSKKSSIQKLASEKGFVGDSLAGLVRCPGCRNIVEVVMLAYSLIHGTDPAKYQWGEILQILPPDPNTAEESIRRNIRLHYEIYHPLGIRKSRTNEEDGFGLGGKEISDLPGVIFRAP